MLCQVARMLSQHRRKGLDSERGKLKGAINWRSNKRSWSIRPRNEDQEERKEFCFQIAVKGLMTKRDELFACENRVAAWSLGAEQVKTPPAVGRGECNKQPSGLLTAMPELACGLEQGGNPKDTWSIYSSPWDPQRMQSCRMLRTCGWAQRPSGEWKAAGRTQWQREAQQTPGCLDLKLLEAGARVHLQKHPETTDKLNWHGCNPALLSAAQVLWRAHPHPSGTEGGATAHLGKCYLRQSFLFTPSSQHIIFKNIRQSGKCDPQFFEVKILVPVSG